MAERTMNRWIVVVFAILIQLALGAIYAWSVFTPGLTLPLEEDGFEQDATIVIDGVTYTVVLGEVLDSPVVDSAAQEATVSIIDPDGDPYPGTIELTIASHIADEDGAEVSKVIVKGDTKYEKDDPKYDYVVAYAGDETSFDAYITANGNWHFVIAVSDSGGASVEDGNANILVNDGIVGDFGFTATETQMIFSAGLATFAVMTIVGGKVLSPKIGPRWTAMLGGILLGSGYIGAGAAGTTFMSQIALIGIVGGAGIGLAYVVPIAVCVNWFPDRKGLITGMGVAGFGFGAFLWVQLGNGYLGTLIADMGILAVFTLYGLIFLAMTVVSSLFMVNPPEGYRPRGWSPPAKGAKASSSGGVEFESGEMLRTRQFWTVWLLFVFGALAGLMVIGNIAIFGIDALQDSGFEKDEATMIAANAMALFAITNGIGRIAWGAVSDRLGRARSIFLMSLTQGLLVLAFLYMGANPWTFTVVAMAIGFNFGGNFTLYPTITADFFGNKSVGRNYGFVFTSYGVGGIVGPILGGYASETDAGFAMAFVPAGVLCLIGAALALTLSPPRARRTPVKVKKAGTKDDAPSEGHSCADEKCKAADHTSHEDNEDEAIDGTGDGSEADEASDGAPEDGGHDVDDEENGSIEE